jgi:hypothetical protein
MPDLAMAAFLWQPHIFGSFSHSASGQLHTGFLSAAIYESLVEA